MATNDLYRIDVNCSTGNRQWSFGLWAEEVDPLDANGDGQTVSDAFYDHIEAELRAIISTGSQIGAVCANKRYVGFNPGGNTIPTTLMGLRTGSAMPNDNALVFNLQQSAAGAKHNGMLYIAGQTDSDQAGSEWLPAYFTGPVAAFATKLLAPFPALSPNTGTWRIVVLSKTISPPTTGIGTPLDVTKVSPVQRVMTQSRRRQKAHGFTR